MSEARAASTWSAPARATPALLTLRAVELIARADVILYDRLIPASALEHARPDAELIDVGKEGGGEQVPQDETTALLVEHALAGRERRAPEGRRPVRLRARRRGGARLPRGRDPVRGRARDHGRDRRARLRRHPGHAARARERRRVRHRPRGSGEAGDADRLAGARGVPGTLVFYMGVRQLAADRRAADRGRTRRGAAGRGRRARHARGQRSVAGRCARSPASRPRRSSARRRSPSSATSPRSREPARAGSTRRARSAACSVAVTRARAQASALARATARARRRRRRGAGDPHRAARRPTSRPAPATTSLLTSPNGAEQLLERASATPARSRARGSR